MNADHLYIFTDNPEADANLLLDTGFSEGPSRIHVGQGTQNRKFYWSDFFLELLWVCDPLEVQTPDLAPTLLWERSQWRFSGYSRFGLCLENNPQTDSLFDSAWQYQPAYFPLGTTIAMINDLDIPSFPALFRLPFAPLGTKHDLQKAHANGSTILTQLQLEYQSDNYSKYADYFLGQNTLQFVKSRRNWVHLYFDNGAQNRKLKFPELNLTILL